MFRFSNTCNALIYPIYKNNLLRFCKICFRFADKKARLQVVDWHAIQSSWNLQAHLSITIVYAITAFIESWCGDLFFCGLRFSVFDGTFFFFWRICFGKRIWSSLQSGLRSYRASLVSTFEVFPLHAFSWRGCEIHSMKNLFQALQLKNPNSSTMHFKIYV